MTGHLEILRVGPGATIQDLGRPGHVAAGMSQGGAVDRLALFEAAALLNQASPTAAIELAMSGGIFRTTAPVRIALTGAPMAAMIDRQRIAWTASHLLEPGQELKLGTTTSGIYSYLSFGGGIDTPQVIGSRATHLAAGLGRPLRAGDTLPLGQDKDIRSRPMTLPADDRFAGGTVRVIPGPQTEFFNIQTRDRFFATAFTKSAKSNRQGVRMDQDKEPFGTDAPPDLVSDLIVPGDIQMTGLGVPYVLLAECQTTGGYPRIGTVIPADLPKIAQARPGTSFRFKFVSHAEADTATPTDAALLRLLRAAVQPLVRSTDDIADLLSYQLISGVTAGDDLERA